MSDNGTRLNLQKTAILLLEPNPQNMAILCQVLAGFGGKVFHRCATIEEARKMAEALPVELVIADGQSPKGEPLGYDFVKWLRHSDLEPNAYTPAILTSAHSSVGNVARARDCGAHFVIAKPIVPGVLFDRVMWVARENRRFVNAGDYAGPDRRFKNVGPPKGLEGRRAGDLKGDVPPPSEPNMSQEQIDALLQPTRAAL